ncbi:MAG: hypothetical protein QOE39_755 [Bradyrhizobium sp.]|jgi:hypothetical protein|nr:hypothetical protein [Bradyrhizobium sp.]
MVYATVTTDDSRSRRRISSADRVFLVLAAFALAAGAAAWIADGDSVPLRSGLASLGDTHASSTSSFDDRFSVGAGPDLIPAQIPPQSLAQSVFREIDIKFEEAKGRLAQKLQSQDWRAALIDEPAPSQTIAIPLPRSRPVVANLEPQTAGPPAAPLPAAQPPAAQSDNRTMLQKLSDLIPGRITLASLDPSSGFSGNGPDLASLGYDNLTAVYDISARAVYMPNGSRLEAHSGLGSLMDDPGHVNERNVGATPPNVYDLKLRERLFHGVEALRMVPVGANDTLGRSGLLAHSYMLGPNGDSNGCVSIKNYERFLSAFKNGEIKRLVVVPSLNDGASASQRSTSQS